jgi:hypothetical protein
MTEPCPECALWELRYLVAIRAGYYLTLHIRETALREAVLDHLCAAWILRFRDGAPNTFRQFFAEYCRDVETDMHPLHRNHPAELRRVWTNHARILRDDLNRIGARP